MSFADGESDLDERARIALAEFALQSAAQHPIEFVGDGCGLNDHLGDPPTDADHPTV